MRTCIAVIPISKLIQRVLVLLQAHLAWKVRFRQLKKAVNQSIIARRQ